MPGFVRVVADVSVWSWALVLSRVWTGVRRGGCITYGAGGHEMTVPVGCALRRKGDLVGTMNERGRAQVGTALCRFVPSRRGRNEVGPGRDHLVGWSFRGQLESLFLPA